MPGKNAPELPHASHLTDWSLYRSAVNANDVADVAEALDLGPAPQLAAIDLADNPDMLNNVLKVMLLDKTEGGPLNHNVSVVLVAESNGSLAEVYPWLLQDTANLTHKQVHTFEHVPSAKLYLMVTGLDTGNGQTVDLHISHS